MCKNPNPFLCSLVRPTSSHCYIFFHNDKLSTTHFLSLYFSSLLFSSLHFTSLHFTSLHFHQNNALFTLLSLCCCRELHRCAPLYRRTYSGCPHYQCQPELEPVARSLHLWICAVHSQVHNIRCLALYYFWWNLRIFGVYFPARWSDSIVCCKETDLLRVLCVVYGGILGGGYWSRFPGRFPSSTWIRLQEFGQVCTGTTRRVQILG
ncbi:hypothetical protein GQ42DRAFT_72320 [Ramicandelaber brevisporus]|nr:hypothetical protein GQ42DRAFT_72320 [Ramicandelaber brevisporus]